MDVLLIDDDPSNLILFRHLLNGMPDLRIYEAESGAKALAWCDVHQPDLVLVDFMMPEMNGLQFIERFRALPGMDAIPLIMATAEVDGGLRESALNLQANDFLSKPVNRPEFMSRVGRLLDLRRHQLRLAESGEIMAEAIKNMQGKPGTGARAAAQREELSTAFGALHLSAHGQRVARYAHQIAINLGLPRVQQELVRDATPLHDIGVVAMATIDTSTLRSASRHGIDALEILQEHTEIGAQLLGGSDIPLLRTAATIALTHHEHVDGSGYPAGLRGRQIPIYGRIVAVADAFDDMTTASADKPAWQMHRAAHAIRQGSGSRFDAQCVAALFRDWQVVIDLHQQCHAGSGE